MPNAKEEFLSHYALKNLNLEQEFDGAQVKHNTSWEEKDKWRRAKQARLRKRRASQ